MSTPGQSPEPQDRKRQVQGAQVHRTQALGIAGWLTQSFITSALTPLIILAALAVGMISLLTLPREEEPQISVPMVDIHIAAPGLRAEDAVKLVTEPMETILRAIDGVEHVYSQTGDDSALVMARFRVGTAPDAAILRVHEKIRANLDRIPHGIAEPLIVARGIDDVAILSLTLSAQPGAVSGRRAGGADPSGAVSAGSHDLTRLARQMQAEISKLDDVGLTYLTGAAQEAIRIAPDPDRLALYGITLQQLADKVGQANRAFRAGGLRSAGGQSALIAGRTLSAPSDIAGLLLSSRDGRPVLVADVADVSYVPDSGAGADAIVASLHLAPDGTLMRSPAVTLAVAKRPGANAVTLSERILHRVATLEQEILPAGVHLEVTRNYGETANEKANELLFHLGLATVSIIALVLAAIGWRESLVVAIVIPVTILLTLFAAQMMGYTLNRVSLFALIFSIGILVDDAIVVIENIARHWAMPEGGNRIQRAVAAVAEVGNPTITATLTVVAALLPMLFVSGLMGPYMSPIPAVASAAMVFSFFIAVIVTPWLMLKIAGRARPGAAHLSGPHDGGTGGNAGGQGGRLGVLYARIARPLLRSRRRAGLFLIATVVLSFGSLGLIATRHVTVKLLPFDNKSTLSVMLDLPEGASAEATDRVAQAVAGAVLALPEVRSVQSHAGTAAPFDFNGLVRHSYLRGEPWQGEVQVNLGPKSARARSSHQIALDIRARLAGLDMPAGTRLKTVEPPPGPPVLATLLAEVYGPDAQTRRAAAARIRQAFEAVPFIVDTDDSFGTPPMRLRATISTDDLEFHKVSESDVFDTLGLLAGSTTVGYSHRGAGRAPLPIVMERPKGQRLMDETALSTPIPADPPAGQSGTGQSAVGQGVAGKGVAGQEVAARVVELGDVLRLAPERASFPIFRRNGREAEMVQAELAGAFEAPLYGMMAVERALDAMDWPEGERPVIRLHGQPEDESRVTLLWEGEWEVTWVTFRDMGAAFGVALMAIYILVVAQFGSFKLPLVVLTPVPLTLLGIMAGHWLFGAPFSATSMIGFIALAGIIVRNSILLVDFIRMGQGTEGAGPTTEALVAAGAVRFKPIVLTALAAMTGAAVILFDPIFQGLALSLLFGLLSSTLLTVLVIPAIYRVFRS